MSMAQADVPAKEGKMPSANVKVTAPPGAQRVVPAYLPAPIDEVNASIAAIWESTGTWKRLAQAVNSPDIKERMLKLCNMQEMPLIGVDIIPTQQGLKLYVNGEGAKFNRERYLAQNGRQMIERKIDIVPYEQIPGSDPGRDKAQGRIYFRITTTCEDVAQKDKIVSAVANGIVKATEVMELLKALKIVTENVTYSAFSNQSEKFSDNRQPDVILKKGITQSHRRADLEISSQCVIPEDEEPQNADFLVKSDEAIKNASAAAQAGASLPATTLVPDKAAKQPDVAHAAPAAAAPAAQSEVVTLMTAINAVFDAAKLKKVDRVKWFTERGYPIAKDQMTEVILKKALSEVQAQFAGKTAQEAPAAAAPAQEAPKAAQAKPEPEKAPQWKQEALKKVFGLREKAGFKDDEAMRAWVKERFGKGLSEMEIGEFEGVIALMAGFATAVTNHETWGFPSVAALMVWAEESGKKPFYSYEVSELTKMAADFADVVGG